jgi:hypothetical protein
MLFSRFAQSTAALLLLTVGFAAPVHAQQNKQIISGTWYEDRATAASSTASQVLLTFAQTPANQFLNITNVTCSAIVSTGQVIYVMELYAGTTPGANDLGRPYSFRGGAISESTSSDKFYSVVTNQIYYKFGPGRYPTIEIDSTASSGSLLTTNFNCVIVGNLTDS